MEGKYEYPHFTDKTVEVQTRLSNSSKEMKLLSYGAHTVGIYLGYKILALPTLPYCSPRIPGLGGDRCGDVASHE